MKNKRRRNRTLTLGGHEMFLPATTDQEQVKDIQSNPSGETVGDYNPNPSGLSPGSSDPGICLKFGSSSDDDEANSHNDKAGSVSADSLDDDVDLELFEAGEREDAVSLAFLEESATVHKYIASRGQREKEQEIYEVVPSTILIKQK